MKKGYHFRVAQKVFLFNRQGQVLILKFADDLLSEGQGGKWDFPGGKVLFAETLEQGLAREVMEEVGSGVEIKVGELVTVWDWYHFSDASKRTVCLGYEAKYLGGEIELNKEHEEWRWVEVEALEKYSWFEADYKAVTKLKELYGQR